MKRILIIRHWKNRFQVEDSNNLTNVIAVRKQIICSAHRASSSFTCRMTSTKVNGIQEVQKERMWLNYLVSYETSFSGFSITLNSYVALITSLYFCICYHPHMSMKKLNYLWGFFQLMESIPKKKKKKSNLTLTHIVCCMCLYTFTFVLSHQQMCPLLQVFDDRHKNLLPLICWPWTPPTSPWVRNLSLHIPGTQLDLPERIYQANWGDNWFPQPCSMPFSNFIGPPIFSCFKFQVPSWLLFPPC